MCNDKKALFAALASLELEREDILDCTTAHDPDCGRYSERCCDCEPRISLETKAGTIEIGLDGELKIKCLN